MSARLSGILAAILTPVDERLEPQSDGLIEHARWLLASGCDGLNVLGTTGEFASFSRRQRLAVMDAMAASGLGVERMIAGTGAAALDDAVALTAHAVASGYAGALVIPPFYYKDVDAEGIFAYYARLIDTVGDARLRLYLYHFPRMSGVAFDPALVARLVSAYPGIVAGLKDSAGDMAFVQTLRRELPDFDVFPASESSLVDARRLDCAGCISATVNVTAPFAQDVWSHAASPDAAERQARVAAMRSAIAASPLVPSLHALVGRLHGNAVWERLLPPFRALTRGEVATLDRALSAAGYPVAAGAAALAAAPAAR